MATEPNEVFSPRHDPYLLDRRLTVLEARFDTVLPTLATKADVATVRTDLATLRSDLNTTIYTQIAGLTRWLLTLTITMLLGFAGLFVTLLTLLRP